MQNSVFSSTNFHVFHKDIFFQFIKYSHVYTKHALKCTCPGLVPQS